MKNVLEKALKATVVASVVAGAAIVSNAQEAAAFNIVAPARLDLSGTQPLTASSTGLDFNGPGNSLSNTAINIVGSSSGVFTALAGTAAEIFNLTLADLSAGKKDNWIRLFNTASATDDIFFSLTAINSANVLPGGSFNLGVATFAGKFTTLNGDSLADGFAVASLNPQTNSGPWTMSIFATSSTPQNTVPTPALLPGLIGMGIAAARKRQAKTAVA